MWNTWRRDVIAQRIDGCLKRQGIDSDIPVGATGPIEFCGGEWSVREVSPHLEQIGDASLLDDLSLTVNRDTSLLALHGYPSPEEVRVLKSWRALKQILAQLGWQLRRRR